MSIPIPKQGLALARALVEHFEACEKLNSIEQAIADSQAQVNGNRVTASEIVGNAKDEARAILSEARAHEASAIGEHEDARRKAAQIIADAKAQAERELAAARGECLAQQTAALDSEERAKSAEKSLATAREKLAELAPKLGEAEQTIAKAEAIKRAMG